MLILSPPTFSSFGCPLEEPNSLETNMEYYNSHNNIYGDTSTTSLHDYSFPQHHLASPDLPHLEFHPEPATPSSDNRRPPVTKKHSHNASERDRRKRINDLYSSLRALLPLADQMRRLSIPATISRVLKYIPELQEQVERLIEKKEQLSSKIISRQRRPEEQLKKQPDGTVHSSSTIVSAAKIDDGEIVVQISTLLTNHRGLLLSEVLLQLEEDGFHLINVSSSESIGGRVFLSLHLQDLQRTEGTQKIDRCEELSKKLLSLFQERR